MWEALQQSSWIVTFNDTHWMFETVSVIHYFTLFIFVGMTAMLDLRILGIAGRHQKVSQLAEELLPWSWLFLILALVSGFLEFAAMAVDYAAVWPFRAKILVILVALVFAIIVQRNVPKWDRLPAMPASAKCLALMSLLFWLGAILAGVELAPLTGLG
jgi:hypothetical protein